MAASKLMLQTSFASSVAPTNVTVASNHGASNVVMTSGSFGRSEIFVNSRCLAAPTFIPGVRPIFSRSITPECKINKGDSLPSVSLKDQNGKAVNLSAYKGRPLVLYFYPADETPGCTKQACAFRDSYEKFKKAGAEVVGVSADGPDSHRAFKEKYRLPFTLLSDQDNKLRKDWGIPGDFFGSLPGRQTYVFDKNGIVQLIFNNQFQPEKHVDETLKILKS